MESTYNTIFEVYSELSNNKPQIILPMAINAIAIVLIKANWDEKGWKPNKNCSDNIIEIKLVINKMQIKYFLIEAQNSKTWKLSFLVVSNIKLSESISQNISL